MIFLVPSSLLLVPGILLRYSSWYDFPGTQFSATVTWYSSKVAVIIFLVPSSLLLVPGILLR
jgi:hypothetical protein